MSIQKNPFYSHLANEAKLATQQTKANRMNLPSLQTIPWFSQFGAIRFPLLLAMLAMLAGLRATAAITFDAASFTNGAANATSVAWSHSVAADPAGRGMLVVSVAIEATVDRPVSAVTYGSQSLTLVPGSRAVQFSSSTYNATEQWYLPSPAVGTATITVTFPGAVQQGIVVGAVSLLGVNQAAPEAVAINANAGTDGLYSLDITTLTAGAWLVDVANNGSGGATLFTPGASQTKRWDLVAAANVRAAGSTREVPTAGTVNNTWTCTLGTSREAFSISAFAPAPPAAVAVAITSPTEAATVSSTSFPILATASVNPGTVTNVEFYVDSILVGNDTSAPFSLAVSGASVGGHTLEVVAWDNAGNSATSAVVNVTAANLPPSVALTSPANGSPVLVGASVALAATATDDASVTNVDFYVDGSRVGSDNSSPYNGSWSSATLGAHALTAVAWDNGGLSTTSAVVNITGYASFAAYEPFNYSLGNLVNGAASTANGFSGNWTCGAAGTVVAGLTYPDLPTTANALSSGGSRQYVSFTAPLSSGTEYVSFLFKTTAGNPGANINGVYFANGGTGLWFGFGLAPASPTQGRMGLGSMNTVGTSALGATSLSTSPNLQTYGTTNLIVLKIDFNTSGNNDTVTVYINPAAGTNVPGVAADQTLSTFDVGTITGIGVNVQGATTLTVDEIRRGSTYGDVVGYSAVPPTPTIPTTLALSIATGKQVSWTAFSTNTYQPQKSTDNSVWANVGSLLFGNAVTSLYETAPAPFYQVLEFIPGGPGPDVMVNGSFEIPAGNNVGAANWNGPANTPTASQYVTNQYDALLPTEGTSMLFMEGTNGTGSVVECDFVAISGGLTYKVVFDAANPVKLNGGNPQYRVQFFNAGNAWISDTGWGSLLSVGGAWTTISNNYAAPGNAASLQVQFLEAVGGGAHWVTVVDNVRVSALATVGATNVLTPTLQAGAGFTATVQTNGVTATAATGTVTFRTNSVQLSANGVATGSATSATALLNPPYTVTAIYSGDATYIGSTNTLTVNAVNTTPTNITSSVSGNQLTLSWPPDYTGWTLQAQTNDLTIGITDIWTDVVGSDQTNTMILGIDPANPSVFFRLVYP